MIRYIDNNLDENQLLGKIIFHATKGGSAIFRGPTVTDPTSIGCRLGEVVEVNGLNRIYYNDEDGNKKYVNSSVIGCFCDNDTDANNLEVIIDQYNEKARMMINSLASELNKEINAI